jgi:hypothetical protein
MRSSRELDPDAGFVAIVTASLLAAGLIMFAPEVLQSDWRSLLLRQELPQAFKGSSNFEKALAFTGREEGGCQDWDRDNGNHFQGRRGWTCFGITPGTAYQAVKDGVISLPKGVDYWTLNKWFDADESGFKDAATKIYKHYYFDPIKADDLPEVVAVVSFDISVNGGSGLANGFLKQTAHIDDAKKRASEINRLMESHYRGIVARNPSQAVFLKGWLNRAEKQKELIKKY